MLSPQRGKPTNLPITRRSIVTPANALEWVVHQPELIGVAALMKVHDAFNVTLDALNETQGHDTLREVENFEKDGSAWLSETQALLLSPPWHHFPMEKVRRWQRFLTMHYTCEFLSFSASRPAFSQVCVPDALLVVHQFALEDALGSRDSSLIRRESSSITLAFYLCCCLCRKVRLFHLSASGATRPRFISRRRSSRKSRRLILCLCGVQLREGWV